MKAYIRTDPLMDEAKAHYTPAQFGAFNKVKCMAARQKNRGRFRSLQALRNLLPAPYVRHLPFLVDEGDLVELDDGTLYLDGWDEWQEGDYTVAERMQRLRNRQRNATVTPTVTEPYPPVIHSDPDSYVDGRSKDLPTAREPDVVLAYNEATLRNPQGWILDRLNELAGRFGEAEASEAVRKACAQHAGDKPSVQLNAAETLLLADERKRRQAAEQADAEAEREYQRQERERIDSMPPEQRAANMARLREALPVKGMQS